MPASFDPADLTPRAETVEILDARPGRRVALPGRQKAAIVVRLLLAEGVRLPLASLPDHVQAELTEAIGAMRRVDRATLEAVVEEFVGELETLGLAFPGGLSGALTMLDGQISTTAASRLRRMIGMSGGLDPWDRLALLDTDQLLPVLEQESLEIGAVMLSKLRVDRAAELLEKLPGDRARRLAHAMSRTARVAPDTVRRIGLALLQQLDAQPPRAFETGAVERVGAILNSSPAATRETVLQGLDETDPDFAEEVRKAIFTFANIPQRLEPRDVPKVLRAVDQAVLLRALAAAPKAGEAEAETVEFLLANVTQRMGEGLRAELAEAKPVSPREGEEAMAEVVAILRRMADEGDLNLITDAAPAR